MQEVVVVVVVAISWNNKGAGILRWTEKSLRSAVRHGLGCGQANC